MAFLHGQTFVSLPQAFPPKKKRSARHSRQASFIHISAQRSTEKKRTRKFVGGPASVNHSGHQPFRWIQGLPPSKTDFPPWRTIAFSAPAFQRKNQPSRTHSRPVRCVLESARSTTASKPTPSFVVGQT